MVSGALGIFSFFNLTTYTFFSILLYIGELVVYMLIGYRLFFLIGDFGTALSGSGKTSKDIEKGETKGNKSIEDKVVDATAKELVK